VYAVPATQRPGLEDRKKEDDAGECMIGEIKSDGGSETGECQDEDGLEAEGGESADKWKGEERDGRKRGGESRNESRLEMS
jgi:hypothetical protein